MYRNASIQFTCWIGYAPFRSHKKWYNLYRIDIETVPVNEKNPLTGTVNSLSCKIVSVIFGMVEKKGEVNSNVNSYEQLFSRPLWSVLILENRAKRNEPEISPVWWQTFWFVFSSTVVICLDVLTRKGNWAAKMLCTVMEMNKPFLKAPSRYVALFPHLFC